MSEMSEFDTLFPAVHRFGEEQLGIKKIEGQFHYKVIPFNTAEDDMKDYFSHETAHLFGIDEPAAKLADDASTKLAAERMARRQKTDDYLKAYSNTDNLDGEDIPKGLLDVSNTFGIIEITATDGLDLELMHHLSEQRPEIAELVENGAPVQTHYLQDLGVVSVDNTDVVEAFEALRGAATLRAVKDALQTLVEILPARHARRLRSAVAKTLNDCVAICMGTNTVADDYLDDISDLLTHIEGNFGARYTQVLMDEVPKIISERCAILVEFNGDDGEIESYRHCLLGMYTTIPIEAKRMNLAIGQKKPFGFVSESRFPELYKALDQMLSTESMLDKPAGFHDIRIETMDGYTMRAHRSLLGNKLLLSKI